MAIQARSLTAGQPVLALDAMPLEFNASAAGQSDVSSTTFISWNPEVSITFEAPTSGRVLVFIGGGMNTDSGLHRLSMAPEIRLRDENGVIVQPPSISRNSWSNSSNETQNNEFGTQISLVEGLVPGEAYFARAMIAVNGTSGTAADSDADSIQIFIVPTA